MAITEYDVQPLFAEPFFRTNISDAISDEQIDYLKNLKMRKNKSNLISDNLYIFEEPELKSIKDAVQEALNVYAQEVMGITQTLFVTQSWTLVNNPNVGMHGHSHSNSLISGSLYYCELPQPVASMFFDRHNTYQQLQLNPEQEKQNIFNTPLNVVTPETGEVILFSSGIQHFVEPNTSNQPRYSIAFNTFIKGKLGEFRDVSELTLK
jgi:uncharacterized protein (TIGR02466 family)